MKYQFAYRTTAFDFWQLAMYNTYGSIIGVCNVVFTVAMIVLTVKFGGTVNEVILALLILASCFFPVIQPIMLYAQAKRQVAGLPEQTEIGFDDRGVHVTAGEQHTDIPWNSIRRVMKRPTLIVIFSTATHGFVLSNRVLGKQRASFTAYVLSRMKK
ncbi:MAG: YcxB family protein [bacterium]|nr:YcxB family protein [bacterium]